MPSPLFNAFGNQNNSMGNMGNFLKQFNQFRQTFNGNPEQVVQQMLNSGRITQDQLNQTVNMANQIMRTIRK